MQGAKQKQLPILAIDIAKDTLRAGIRVADALMQQSFTNDPAGMRALKQWLKTLKIKQVLAVMEATGRYWLEVAEALHAAKHKVCVVNPSVIKRHGEEFLQRNKTDSADVDVIESYAQKWREHLREWQPASAESLRLRELFRRCDDVNKLRTAEINRKKAGKQLPEIGNMIDTVIACLDNQLAELEGLIEQVFEQDAELQQKRERLTTIPGIGEWTAARLLALPIDMFDSAEAAASFCGLTPRRRESGKTNKPSHITKMGDTGMRAGLYLPAQTAMRFNQGIMDLVQRLKAKGKTGKQLTVAAMHKLLRQAYGVLKSGQPFDPSWSTRLDFQRGV